MGRVDIWGIEGTEFPAGRRTRVILGQNDAMEGSKFCQDYVVVYKDGDISEHDHGTVESCTIIKGRGEIEVDGERRPVKEGDCIFILGNLEHALCSADEEGPYMAFVYAPSIIVDHWAEEQNGEIKQADKIIRVEIAESIRPGE